MSFGTAPRLTLLVPSLMAFMCLSLSSTIARAEETLHILMVANTTDASIGKSCAVDQNALRHLFWEPSNIPKNKQVSIEFISSDPTSAASKATKFSREAILAYYQKRCQTGAIKPGKDAVLFYYSGHGSYDKDKGLYLNTPGRALLHSELREAILNCQPHLAVIITDCCQQVRPSPTRGFFASEKLGDDRAPIVDALFFKPNGVVDINSCSEKQLAGANLGSGGFFTSVLFGQMGPTIETVEGRLAKEGLPLKHDGVLTWREFFPLLMSGTTAKWKRAFPGPDCLPSVDLPDRKQCTQDPQAFSLPVDEQFDPPGLQHGMSAEVVLKDGKRVGLKITKLQPGSPADKAALKLGDVILTVDNKTVCNADELDCAVNFGPVPGVVHVVYNEDGQNKETTMMLERGK